jgi:hypothetical protein
VKLLIPLALLLAACSATPAADARLEYVIGGQGNDQLAWLTVLRCVEQPHSMRDVLTVCDSATIRSFAVDVPTYDAYNQGDQYPKPVAS